MGVLEYRKQGRCVYCTINKDMIGKIFTTTDILFEYVNYPPTAKLMSGLSPRYVKKYFSKEKYCKLKGLFIFTLYYV